MQPTKSIYILIGPKGSGKTYIGTLLGQHFKIRFLAVENIAIRVKKGRDYKDSGYIEEVFNEIENEVRKCLVKEDKLIFEATGLTDAFDGMLLRLKNDFKVRLISIRTEAEICLSRIKARDNTQQVKVSDKDVLAINARAIEKKFAFDGEIGNNNSRKGEIIDAFEKIVSHEGRGFDKSQMKI